MIDTGCKPFTRSLIAVFCALVVALMALCVAAPQQAFAVTQAELQAQADEAKAELDKVRNEAAKVNDEYTAAQDKRDEAQKKMEEAKAKTAECEEQIAEIQATLSERAVAMYRNGAGNSFIEMFFSADSFVDLINAWDLLNSLNEQDAEGVAKVRELKAESEQAAKEYAAQEIECNKQVQIIAEKKAALDKKVREFETLYANLNAEVEALVTAAYQKEVDNGNYGYNGGGGGNNGGGGGNSGGGYVTNGSGHGFPSAASLAMNYKGKKYRMGGNGPDYWDCSGLVSYCVAQTGGWVPRNSEAMYAAAKERVPVSEAQYGDILYMPGHVGFYIGGGQTIEAEWEKTGVCISRASKYTCALRF